MKKIAPKWVLWVSFILLIIFGIAVFIFAISDLKSLSTDVSSGMGSLAGSAMLLYFFDLYSCKTYL